MKNLLKSITLAALISTASLAHAEDGPFDDHVFVSITSPDINQVGMMMEMANAALKTDRQSTVVLGADGFRNALREGPQNVFAGRDKTPRQMLTEYMEAGGKVHVCGLCLNMYGIEKSDLIDGVELTNGGKVLDAMFETEGDIRTIGF